MGILLYRKSFFKKNSVYSVFVNLHSLHRLSMQCLWKLCFSAFIIYRAAFSHFPSAALLVLGSIVSCLTSVTILPVFPVASYSLLLAQGMPVSANFITYSQTPKNTFPEKNKSSEWPMKLFWCLFPCFPFWLWNLVFLCSLFWQLSCVCS